MAGSLLMRAVSLEEMAIAVGVFEAKLWAAVAEPTMAGEEAQAAVEEAAKSAAAARAAAETGRADSARAVVAKWAAAAKAAAEAAARAAAARAAASSVAAARVWAAARALRLQSASCACGRFARSAGSRTDSSLPV